MPAVLFVCTGNQFRSPIAAGVFREQLVRDGRNTDWLVNSAGTWTSSGLPALAEARELAASFGVDLAAHRTRSVDKELLEEADVILVMESGHKESLQTEFPFTRSKVYLLAQVVEGVADDIPDPAASRGEAREIIRELVEMVRKGAGKIYQLVETKQALKANG
jgi:protein-tyrosine-phosphatase